MRHMTMIHTDVVVLLQSVSLYKLTGCTFEIALTHQTSMLETNTTFSQFVTFFLASYLHVCMTIGYPIDMGHEK